MDGEKNVAFWCVGWLACLMLKDCVIQCLMDTVLLDGWMDGCSVNKRFLHSFIHSLFLFISFHFVSFHSFHFIHFFLSFIHSFIHGSLDMVGTRTTFEL